MLPYGRQTIEEDDIEAVAEVLRGDFLTTGPTVGLLEEKIKDITGAKEAVVCGNGTQALHLAALALGLGEGDTVIVPSMTFLATANAARYCGADVVFSDVNPDTGLMEVSHLEEALVRASKSGYQVKAVFPVHLNGQVVDMSALRPVCEKHSLKMLADSCHALGGSYEGRPIGASETEDMTVFSFHPVKAIAMGEGGAITTNNTEWAHKMRHLRSHNMVKKPEGGPWFYEMPDLGYNYRASDINCALGVSQLGKLSRFIERRNQIRALYDELLQSLAPILLPVPSVGYNAETAWHLYPVLIDFAKLGKSRAEVMNALLGEGIGTQVHYIPVHSQPYYRELYGELNLPGVNSYYERVLSIPFFPAMSDDDVHHVVRAISKILGKGV